MTGFTPQQELVYERLVENYKEFADVAESLSQRVAIILGGGTAIATAFGAAKAFAVSDFTSIAGVMLGAAVVSSLIAFVAASYVWAPRGYGYPGTLEEELLWTRYLDADFEQAFANAVADLIAAIELERDNNEVKVKAFRIMLIAVWVQVIAVFIGSCMPQ